MKKCKKDSNLDEAFEEMRKKAEEGISLAEQIVDLKSYHEHNLKLMKGLNDKINKLEKENQDLRDNYDQFKASAIPEIERLQKENAELRNNGFTVSAMTEQQLKVALEKGEKLEKENAELKEQNRNYEQLIDNGSVTLVKERLKNYKQLIKAKGLIEDMYDRIPASHSDYYKDVMERARQFLWG